MMTKAGKETIKYINKQNILNFFRKKYRSVRTVTEKRRIISHY